MNNNLLAIFDDEDGNNTYGKNTIHNQINNYNNNGADEDDDNSSVYSDGLSFKRRKFLDISNLPPNSIHDRGLENAINKIYLNTNSYENGEEDDENNRFRNRIAAKRRSIDNNR